jgi:hypothetical protein
MVPESKLEKTEHGLVPKGEGWFVLNMHDAVWRHVDDRGAVCVALDDFEGKRQFEQLGVNPFVLRPGEPMAMYHWEADQEDILVVSGEAVLIRASTRTRRMGESRTPRSRVASRRRTATAGFPSSRREERSHPPPPRKQERRLGLATG